MMKTIRTVLVVDDSRTEQFHLREVLERAGYQVRCADGAEQALRLLAEQAPDLILMDVVMPGTNGFALTRQITHNPSYQDIPVFICSSKDQQTDKVWGLRQGASDYFTKPVDAAALLAKIHTLG